MKNKFMLFEDMVVIFNNFLAKAFPCNFNINHGQGHNMINQFISIN